MPRDKQALRFERPLREYPEDELHDLVESMVSRYPIYHFACEEALSIAATTMYLRRAEQVATGKGAIRTGGEVKRGASFMWLPGSIVNRLGCAVYCDFGPVFEVDEQRRGEEGQTLAQRIAQYWRRDKALLAYPGKDGRVEFDVSIEVLNKALRRYRQIHGPDGKPNIAWVLRHYFGEQEVYDIVNEEKHQRNLGLRRTTMYSLSYLMTVEPNRFVNVADTFFPTAGGPVRFSQPYAYILPDSLVDGGIAPELRISGFGEVGDQMKLHFATGRMIADMQPSDEHILCKMGTHKVYAVARLERYDTEHRKPYHVASVLVPASCFGRVRTRVGDEAEILRTERAGRNADALLSRIAQDT